MRNREVSDIPGNFTIGRPRRSGDQSVVTVTHHWDYSQDDATSGLRELAKTTRGVVGVTGNNRGFELTIQAHDPDEVADDFMDSFARDVRSRGTDGYKWWYNLTHDEPLNVEACHSAGRRATVNR